MLAGRARPSGVATLELPDQQTQDSVARTTMYTLASTKDNPQSIQARAGGGLTACQKYERKAPTVPYSAAKEQILHTTVGQSSLI